VDGRSLVAFADLLALAQNYSKSIATAALGAAAAAAPHKSPSA